MNTTQSLVGRGRFRRELHEYWWTVPLGVALVLLPATWHQLYGFAANPVELLTPSAPSALLRLGALAVAGLASALSALGLGAIVWWGIPQLRRSSVLGESLVKWLVIQSLVGLTGIRVLVLLLGELGLISTVSTVLVMVALTPLGLWSITRRFRSSRQPTSDRPPRRRWIVVLLLGAIYLLAVIWRALPVSADGDYLTHYGPYMNEVIQRGATFGGEVWYHYWVSKGNGPGIQLISLTDPNGQIIDGLLSLFLIAGIVWMWITAFSRGAFTALVSSLVVLMMALPAADVVLTKHHVSVAAAVLGASASAAMWAGSRSASDARAYLIVWMLVVVGCATQQPLSVGYCVVALVLALVLRVIRRQSPRASQVVAGLVIAVASTALVWLFNSLHTGFIDQVPWRIWRSLANLERLPDNVSPYVIATLDAGSGATFGTVGTSDLWGDASIFVQKSPLLGLFLESPLRQLALLAVSAALSVVVVMARTHRGRRGLHLGELMGLPASVLVVSIAVGALSGQVTSLSRSSWYLFVYALVAVMGPIALVETRLGPSRRNQALAGRVLLILSTSIVVITLMSDRLPLHYLRGATSLMTFSSRAGGFSEDVATAVLCAQQRGGVLSLAWNNAVGPAQVVGSGVPSSISYALGRPGFEQIAFGAPDVGVAALDSQGLTSILVPTLDAAGQLDAILSFAPVFSPESVARYYNARSVGANHFLLTRKGWPATNDGLTSTLPGCVTADGGSFDDWDFRAAWGLTLKSKENRGLHDLLARKYEALGSDVSEVPISPEELAKGWQ